MVAILRLKSGSRLVAPLALVIALSPILPTGITTKAAPPAQTPPPTNSTPTKPILLTDPVPDPKQDGVLWFPATGHTLRGSFLTYWQQNGGLTQFGYPLTEEFFEPVGPDIKSVQVQYFERNRFEHHPENQPPYDVLLGRLGREFHPQDLPATQQPSPTIFFPETGHNLAGAFQQYWQQNGGLAVHGYPITEAFQEKNLIDGKQYTVQYLERSRFELHPENAGSPYEVLLGLLGRQLSEKKGYPYGWYPLYGHAADLSWTDGKRTPRASCPLAVCSCTFRSDFSIQPVGASWDALVNTNPIPIDMFVVLFGHIAGAGEPSPPVCPSPGYIVTRVQFNPPNPGP